MQTIEQDLDQATARIIELEAALKDPTIVAANGRADAAELVAARLTDQLAGVTAERDALVNEVATLRANYKTAEFRAAEVCASAGIDMLRVSNHARAESDRSASRAEAIAELEAARKVSPDKFAEVYARVGSLIVGS